MGYVVLFYCCCSVAQSCLTLCNPMDYSTLDFSVLHYLLEFAQTHVHSVIAHTRSPAGAVSSQMIRQGRRLFASRSEPGAGLLFKMLVQVRTVIQARAPSARLQEPNQRGAPKESMCFGFLQGITPQMAPAVWQCPLQILCQHEAIFMQTIHSGLEKASSLG